MEPAMLTATQIAGFVGAGLAGMAYVPQISHLIRARCSAGISRLAFGIWLLSSLLVTARAVAIGAGVFIVLGGIQIVATGLIMFCAARTRTGLALAIALTRPGPRPPRGRAPQATSLAPGVRPAAPLGNRPRPPGTADHRERTSGPGVRNPTQSPDFKRRA